MSVGLPAEVTPAHRPRTPSAVQLATTFGAASVGIGYVLAHWAAGSVSTRMLPWVLGRGLGVAGYAALVALTSFGLWLRHPWRLRRPLLAPVAYLRIHSALAAATLVLVAGHVVALVLDKYAGVGVVGALVPGQSGYRTMPVALGTLGLYVGLLVGLTAALAGRFVGRMWLPVHRIAIVTFALVWVHGVLAGSDTSSLRIMYAATGFAVVALAITRRLAHANDRDALVQP